jgi:hypothetical protein
MSLQKQPDGSYITIPDSNTRPLPPEMYKSITVNDIAKDPVAQQQYSQSTVGGATQATQQAPGTGGAAPSSDPVTTFNLAILDMLKTAQSGAGNVDLFKQQRALQRTAIDRTAKITPEDLRVLSPGQQSAIRSGSVQALEPEIDAVASEIKARDSRLAHFESTLGQMREIGLDIAKNISPPKEVIEGYKNMLRMGGDISSIPVEIRNKVLAGLTPEDWTTFEKSQTDKGLVLELAQKYPDAGIAPTDTLQAAQAKISKSRIYQDQVRGPVSSGGGRGGSGSKITSAGATSEIMNEWQQGYIQGNGKIASVDYKKGKEWWKAQGLSEASFDRQFGYLIDKSGENWKTDYAYGQ